MEHNAIATEHNEEEEDYMSEKFLKELEKRQAEEDKASGRSKVNRKRKQPEQPKPQKVVQKETLEKGLATPIPESNIGKL